MRATSHTVGFVVLGASAILVVACGQSESASERHELTAQPEAPRSEPPAPEPTKHDEPVAPSLGLLAIDTHVDTTQRMLDESADITQRLEGGHVDIPRMREGGLNAAFFSIWVDPEDYQGEAAWQRSLALIEVVRAVPERHPDQAMLCMTSECVRAAHRENKIALLMGLEGAHGLNPRGPETALQRLRRVYELGVRYMTITWSVDNPLGHSSTGQHPERGLTDLGRQVIAEMNQLGMMIDVSHVSDATFEDIMDVTTKPVLASHSSVRSLAAHPRNMTDDMIRRVGQNGGAVCVNYYGQYIDDDYRERRRRIEQQHLEAFAKNREHHPRWRERRVVDFALAQRLDPELNPPTIRTLGDHFAHIVNLIGPSGACLGSDFDGVSDLPLELQDVAALPVLRTELARRGIPLEPVFGENVLRVMAANAAGDSSER